MSKNERLMAEEIDGEIVVKITADNKSLQDLREATTAPINTPAFNALITEMKNLQSSIPKITAGHTLPPDQAAAREAGAAKIADIKSEMIDMVGKKRAEETKIFDTAKGKWIPGGKPPSENEPLVIKPDKNNEEARKHNNLITAINDQSKSMGKQMLQAFAGAVVFSAMLKQSKVMSSTLGILGDMAGALIDIILGPILVALAPYLGKVAEWLGELATKIPAMIAFWTPIATNIAAVLSQVYTTFTDAFSGVEGGFFEKVSAGINAVWTDLVWPELQNIFDNIDWTTVGTTIGNKFTEIATTISTFLSNIDWLAIGETISTKFTDIATTVGTYIRNIDWEEVGKTIGTKFAEIATTVGTYIADIDWDNVATTVIDTFSGLASTVTTAMSNLLSKVDWKEVGDTIGFILGGIVNSAVEAIKNTDWQPVAQAVANLIKGIGIGFAEGFFGKEKVAEAGDALDRGFKPVEDMLNTFRDSESSMFEKLMSVPTAQEMITRLLATGIGFVNAQRNSGGDPIADPAKRGLLETIAFNMHISADPGLSFEYLWGDSR
jgi:hypothetical protein